MAHQTHAPSPPPAPAAHPLLLQPLSGPPLHTVRVEPDRPRTLGRASECDIRLDNEVVSKRHAAVSPLGAGWVVRDLGSRHGTHINGIRLTPHESVPLSEGDLLTIKPWVFQVRTRPPDPAHTLSIPQNLPPGERVESLSKSALADGGVNEQYAQLISASGAIYGAANEAELVAAVLDRALAATGFHRAAMIRQGSGGGGGSGRDRWNGKDEVGSDRAGDPDDAGASQVEVLACAPDPDRPFEFSRSLIRAASSGTPALMIAPPNSVPTGSVVRLGIKRALCLPILVEGSVWGYLYLDARRGEPSPRDDAVAFCGALVEMAGLAVANIKGRELRRRLLDLQTDVEAAAHVQRLIMPPPNGRFGPLSYAVRSRPGRLLSGDLFDVVPLSGGRTAVMLGDVAGKGVSAAFLMAVAQTLVRSLLARIDDPGEVLNEFNDYVSRLHDGSRFVSLWLGIFDPDAGTVTAADGGHGYCITIGPDAPATRLQCAGGPVIGADVASRYASSRLPWIPGSRIILFSDGVPEQCGSSGEWFSFARVLDAIRHQASPADDVSGLFAELERFAATPAFTDDVTVASISRDLAG